MSEAEKSVQSNQYLRPGLVHLAVLLAYVLLTLLMTWPMALQFNSAIPGDGFDGWQNYWNLWWMKVALVDRLTWPFVTDILYAPTGVGLYFHTLNPLNGLMTMPVQLAYGLLAAYNSVVLVSWVLAGYGAFLLCLWLQRGIDGRSPSTSENASVTSQSRNGLRGMNVRYLAAFVAGIIYAFAPFHMAHLLGHMQVMSLQWIPFYILFLLRGISKSRDGKPWLRSAILAGLFLVFNGLSDWYFVLYLFLFTGLVVTYYWIAELAVLRSTQLARLRTTFRTAAGVLWTPLIAGLLFAVALSPVLAPMVREAMQFEFMIRPASDLYVLSASMVDYLVPSRMHTLVREAGIDLPGNQVAPISERTIAIGYTALILAGIATATQFRRSRLWIVVVLFFFALSLGPKIHFGSFTMADIPQVLPATEGETPRTLFSVLNRTIPFMSISRSVSRYALMVQLGIAILAGTGLASLLRRSSARGGLMLSIVVVVVLLAEYWVAPYPMSPPDTPEFYADVAASTSDLPHDSGAMLNLPMNYDRPGYLLYQTVHGRPLTVAYISRDDPRTLTERVPVLQHLRHLGPDILDADPAQVGLTVLNDLGIEFVVLDRYKMPGGEERIYTEALAQQIFSGVEPVFVDDRITVFRVPQAVLPVAYVELGPLGWGPLQFNDESSVGHARSIIGDRACFGIRHAPDAGVVEIAYSSASGGVLSNETGRTTDELSPQSEVKVQTVSFTHTAMADEEDIRYCIVPERPDDFTVHQIRLIVSD